MSAPADQFRLDRSGLTPISHIPPTDRMIIESFLSRQAVVRGIGLHLARFQGAIPRFLPGDLEVTLRQILGGRMLFPRLEYHTDSQEIFVRLRPAPPWRSHTRLWVAGKDQRERPHIKGWDLPWLEQLRAEAIARGADDALICHPETGNALETTTGALAWQGAGGLHTVGGGGLLPSTTVQRYRQSGRPLVAGQLPLEELRTTRLWVGNAVHGWTPASIIPDSAEVPAPPRRA